MKIISFITEKDVIRKILEHLGLWEEKIPTEPAPPVPIRERHYEAFDEVGVSFKSHTGPGYEEPTMTIH